MSLSRLMVAAVLVQLATASSALADRAKPKRVAKAMYVPYYSLVVVYRQRLDPEGQKEAADLHEKIGAKVLFRSRKLPIDFVLPKNREQTRDEIEALCKAYRRSTLVNECVVDEPGVRQFGQSGHGAPAGAPAAPVRGDIVDRLEGALPIARQELPALRPGQSLLWAQEYVGADLSTEFLKSQGSVTTPVAIIDSGFRVEALPAEKSVGPGLQSRQLAPLETFVPPKAGSDHGTLTANVVFADDGIGVSPLARIGLLGAGESQGDFVKAIEEAESQGIRLVNSSASLQSAAGRAMAQSQESYLKADPRNVLVYAAGNAYPSPIQAEQLRAARAGGFLVGNLDESGLVYGDSQANAGLLVMAPAGQGLASRARPGQPTSFGGTSAATPVVTAAIANVQALLPAVDRDTLARLIRATAVPTVSSFEKPQRNGVGMINVYGLTRVAGRLRESCAGGSDGACLRRKANEAATYRFDEYSGGKARALLSDGAKNYPECRAKLRGVATNEPYAPTRESRARALKGVREVFFLDREARVAAAELLSCAHLAAGLTRNAFFYASFAFAPALARGGKPAARRTPDFFASLDVNHHASVIAGLLDLREKNANAITRPEMSALVQGLRNSRPGTRQAKLALATVVARGKALPEAADGEEFRRLEVDLRARGAL